jgi:hypothetical protein
VSIDALLGCAYTLLDTCQRGRESGQRIAACEPWRDGYASPPLATAGLLATLPLGAITVSLAIIDCQFAI